MPPLDDLPDPPDDPPPNTSPNQSSFDGGRRVRPLRVCMALPMPWAASIDMATMAAFVSQGLCDSRW